MIRSEKNIIRYVTVSQSLGLCREVMVKIRMMAWWRCLW